MTESHNSAKLTDDSALNYSKYAYISRLIQFAFHFVLTHFIVADHKSCICLVILSLVVHSLCAMRLHFVFFIFICDRFDKWRVYALDVRRFKGVCHSRAEERKAHITRTRSHQTHCIHAFATMHTFASEAVGVRARSRPRQMTKLHF